MTGSFTSAISTFGLLCVFWGYAHGLNAQTSDIESEHCVAEPGVSYFTPLNPASAQTSELCFIRLGEVNDKTNQYLLIDTGAQPRTSHTVSSAIRLPQRQIKTKLFLKNKPLLIFAEPHKRHSLAKLCKDLIQTGFQNPKILIGRISEKDSENWSATVPVDEFIVEVRNFGAVTIATDQTVASELIALGIPAIAAEGSDLKAAVRSATVNYSLSGYLPVFIVGDQEDDTGLVTLLSEKPISRAFVVSGGIERIKRTLKTTALSAAKRLGLHGVSNCAG
ncbi:hypothetical protein [Microbulbifer sp.]|uniref:hypothetical protein n=1 Tax=Microbulbifer sp. TaxID=1908541 RepID=UPI003F352909